MGALAKRASYDPQVTAPDAGPSYPRAMLRRCLLCLVKLDLDQDEIWCNILPIGIFCVVCLSFPCVSRRSRTEAMAGAITASF
jgi:hypothetical protein